MDVVGCLAPDTGAIAKEILAPWVDWLEGISCTPARFCEVMRADNTDLFDAEAKAEALGIGEEEFLCGIESIGSVQLYALILDLPLEELWRGFELHTYPMPRWLLRNAEDAVRDSFANACG